MLYLSSCTLLFCYAFFSAKCAQRLYRELKKQIEKRSSLFSNVFFLFFYCSLLLITSNFMGSNHSHSAADRRRNKNAAKHEIAAEHFYQNDSEDFQSATPRLKPVHSLPSLAAHSIISEDQPRCFTRPFPWKKNRREEPYIKNDPWKASSSNHDLSVNFVAAQPADHLFLWQEKLQQKQQSVVRHKDSTEELIYGSLDRCLPKKTVSNYDNFTVTTTDVARTAGYALIRTPSYDYEDLQDPENPGSAFIPTLKQGFTIPTSEYSRQLPAIPQAYKMRLPYRGHDSSTILRDRELLKVEKLQADLLSSDTRKKGLWIELQTLLSQRRLMQNSLEFLLNNRSELKNYATNLSAKIEELRREEVNASKPLTVDFCDRCCTRF